MSTLSEDAQDVRKRELVERVAQGMADRIGHGKYEKCLIAATIAVEVIGEQVLQLESEVSRLGLAYENCMSEAPTETLKMMRRAANALESQVLRWIPCAEREPEPNTDVIGYYPAELRDELPEIDIVGRSPDGNWFCLYGMTHAPTHWMPLPRLPGDVPTTALANGPSYPEEQP